MMDKINSNSSIDRQEFANLAQEAFDLNTSQSDSLFTEIDVDGSGSLSSTEIDEWVTSKGGIDSLQQYFTDSALSDDDLTSAANPIILVSDHSLLMVIVIILCIIALTLCIMTYKMYTQKTPGKAAKVLCEPMEMESDVEEPLKRRIEE